MSSFPSESDLFPAGPLAPATAKTKWQQFFQAVTGLLGTSGAAVDARSALGAAAKGANGDITQLTGLTTPLSVDQGGSGASDAAGALRNLGITSLPVRQTVLAGPVDSNGASAFGGSTGGTTVTASGTLVAAAANGFNVSGQVNRIGSITNPSWTGLNTNGTMYLGLLVNADGTCTPFSTTLAPNYQWGGTYSTTNNQRTFNIQEMCMKKGNGSSAAQAYEVFVGEVTVAGGVVTAITWYALMGRYNSGRFAVTAATSYSKSHNLGVQPTNYRLLGASTAGQSLVPVVVFSTANPAASNNGASIRADATAGGRNSITIDVLQVAGLPMGRDGSNQQASTGIAEMVAIAERGW